MTFTKTLAGSCIAAAVAMPAVAAEKWDMPMAYAASNYHSEVGAEFAQCVTSGTGGEIEITTHPGGALFAGADIKRAVQTGQVPIGERLLSGHQNENAVFGYDNVPFLATSFDDAEKLADIARPTIEKLLAEQNLTLLYSVPWPPQGLYFNKEINSVSDMKGVKFRSYNNSTSRFAELTGMLPVTIEAAEISQAFATGVAEAMISSGATGYDRKVWESLSHFYEVNSWLPRNSVMVNSDVWASVSDENKAVITGCAETAAANGLERAKSYTKFTMDGLAEGGMTVGPASDALVEELKTIGDTMAADWLEAAGEDGKAIIDAFKAAQ
ncbi:C4-dicarboxylate ABC transporter substrate-binding protein [Aliishimia ponticola]|uniref:C4-dicarboxylate ABC transporter substrate-binding protein n=1 Tax=Aliishimia ponticola TaxID=2499833 RepID=A0A4S4NL46_9RHOB|nr:TRAP transporter substrate-binding protein [Aliishimia ponticola]THH36880.1 C4-dicarboxylate ABC transporter substrate-binding protein [Aliishimia ponticola]